MADPNRIATSSVAPEAHAPQHLAGRPDTAWQVQDAKARFSELLDAALREGPQVITRRGVEIAAVVHIEHWRRLASAAPSVKDVLLEPGAVPGVPPPVPRERHRHRADCAERSDSPAYLADGPVILALLRQTKDPAVLEWIAGVPAHRLYIAAMAIGVIQQVVEDTRAKGTTIHIQQAQELEEWLLRLRCAYGVLAADAVTYRQWGLLTHREPEAPSDTAMVAATALARGLTVATDNVEFFEKLGLPTVNPFEPNQ